MRGELGEVVRRRVRIDDPVAGHAREADVRHGREREAVAAHRVQRAEGGLNPGAVVRADGGDVELLEPGDRVACRHARERLGVLVEREHGEDGERRDAPDRGDCALQFRQVEEGLDGEEVHAPAFENFRLLGEDLRAVLVRDRFQLAEWPDRAGDEHVPAGHFSRVAGELDGARVDRVQVILEVVRSELPAVGAEGVRLDQVGAGGDEACVQLHDGLGRAQIGLFGHA